MRFRCPFCYYTISVDDTSRGYPVVCAGCGKEVMISPGRFDPGCIIGDFVILEKLGAGSIGTVYKATQLSLDRQVALKILSPEYTTSKGIDDCLREARAAAKSPLSLPKYLIKTEIFITETTETRLIAALIR